MTSTPILCTDSIAQWERPHSIRGGPGSIPGQGSSIFGIWREVLGRNEYITSQYFFPAIIYRDIISHITSTYRYIMYFFRTFKKSTAPYKVHNMGLRYIKSVSASRHCPFICLDYSCSTLRRWKSPAPSVERNSQHGTLSGIPCLVNLIFNIHLCCITIQKV